MRTLECWLPSFRFVLKSNNLTACSHASEGDLYPAISLFYFLLMITNYVSEGNAERMKITLSKLPIFWLAKTLKILIYSLSFLVKRVLANRHIKI